jgi:methyl-accepting chemotaxis protein
VGDQFNLSGDFRGAIFNIKSTLNNVQQSVGKMRTNNQAAKEELQALIAQLNETLQAVPPENCEDAESVAQMAKMLVETASAERPNESSIKITSEGLKQAAQNLTDAMPTVVTIASQIVLAVFRLTGMAP